MDAETIGPELLTLVQGFFPDAATCDMAKFHEKEPFKQDYRVEWKTLGQASAVEPGGFGGQHVGSLVS